MGWLTEPLQFGFMQTAFVTALFVSVTCATLGVYVVVRRMAFIGDAMAHTTLPGLVVAYLNGLNLFLGALLAGLLTAFGIGWLTRREMVREDTAIGIIFTGMFALGILMMSTTRSFRDLTQMLFGNILGVTGTDLALIAGVTVLVLGTLALFHKEFELTSFDPTHAEVIGLRTDLMRFGLLTLLALTVVAGVQVVGVILTNALLVTPAAAASLLTRRLPQMMALASAIALGSAFAGLYASYYLEVPSGPAIVLACILCFGVAWLVQRVRLAAQPA